MLPKLTQDTDNLVALLEECVVNGNAGADQLVRCRKKRYRGMPT